MQRKISGDFCQGVRNISEMGELAAAVVPYS